MSLDEIRLKLEPFIKKSIESQGFDLIDLNIKGHKNDVMIEVTADKPNGGISIGECAIINKSLVAAIEQEQLLPPEVFSLELSSPGLDRPLVSRKDFMRLVGQELHFWLKEAVNGKKETQGILKAVNESELIIIIKSKKELILPLSIIIKGMLVI
jgi:ribosome maturation factor RimP